MATHEFDASQPSSQPMPGSPEWLDYNGSALTPNENLQWEDIQARLASDESHGNSDNTLDTAQSSALQRFVVSCTLAIESCVYKLERHKGIAAGVALLGGLAVLGIVVGGERADNNAEQRADIANELIAQGYPKPDTIWLHGSRVEDDTAPQASVTFINCDGSQRVDMLVHKEVALVENYRGSSILDETYVGNKPAALFDSDPCWYSEFTPATAPTATTLHTALVTPTNLTGGRGAARG